MQYDVEIGGRIRHVTVVRTGASFAVTVDGRTRSIDVARIDAQTLSLLVDGVWPKDVVVTPNPASGQLTVVVDGMPVDVAVNGRRTRRRRADAGQAATGPQRVNAPMPGKVVRVLVNAGDAVRARQPLAVIEAMKMENELRAGRDGTVAEVLAQQGDSVEAGALLIVIQ
jgi:biotin carboxyl carrier protein